MRTRGNAHWLRRGTPTFRIAEVARRGFELRDHFRFAGMFRVEHFQSFAAIGHHENISVRTIRGAQAAADAVIFDHDLQMFPAVD